MYLVNISFFVSPAILAQWLGIVKDNLIPLLRQTGFGRVTFSRVVREEGDEQAVYSLLVEVENMELYEKLTGKVFGHYLKESAHLPSESVLWFTTLMETEQIPD